jgi:hypothetical protein
MRPWNRSLLTAAGAVAVASMAGCTDGETPVGPEATTPADAAVALPPAAQHGRADEVHFHRLAAQIPGYGGHFFDESGNLVVHVTDLAQSARARAVLAPVLQEWRAELLDVRPGRKNGEVVVRRGDFSFEQLAGWRDVVSDKILGGVPGVIFNDLSESSNRVVIGVEREQLAEMRAMLIPHLEQLGVPAEGVEIVGATRPVQEQQLTDYVRPLVGGLQVEWSIWGSYLNTCTMGFLAQRSGVDVMVTNSHCSYTQWAKDDTEYHQNVFPGNTIGMEWHDPGFRSCGFLSVNKCRDADANLVAINPGVWFNRGRLARTTYWGGPGRPATGSLTIDSSQPTWVSTGKVGTSEGNEVDKVGRTTGWTFGYVRHSCVDYTLAYRTILRCQQLADYGSAGGDSGSPVFRITSFSNSTAQLQGIHWGGNAQTSKCDNCAVFSSIGGIEADLGSLYVVP